MTTIKKHKMISKNSKKKEEPNQKVKKINTRTLKNFKIIGYFSLLVLFIFSYFLFRLNILPMKYLIPILVILFLLDGGEVAAIHFFKKNIFKITKIFLDCN